MATFVLVPGATLGSWCWKRVTPLLRNQGHEVYTITLTGLAERAHLMSPAVTLETHVQDIVSLIEWEDLTDVILVGHSLGVDPVNCAADRIPERIAQIVYFDSFPSKNGESGFDSDNKDFQAWILSQVIQTERGPLFQPPDSRMFGLSDEADVAWANAKMTPHPFNAWTAIIHLHNQDALARIVKTYVVCIGDNPPEDAPPHAAGMHYYEIPYGHLAMISAPEAVAKLFQTITEHPVAQG